MTNLIPGIEKFIQKKLKELNLKPKTLFSLPLFQKENKRFYSTICETEKKELVFLKILITKEKREAKRLKKEIEITKFLSKISKKKKKLNIPLFVKGESKKLPYWFLHQYLPGPLVGHHFKMKRVGQGEKIIKKIIDNLLIVQEIPWKKKIKFSLDKREFSDYIKIIRKREKQISFKKGKGEIDFQKIYQFFKEKKNLFKKENYVLAHGDFTLANFFVHKNNVFITDWEQIHLDNIASDVSLLWNQTYRYPGWRRKLISYFLSSLSKRKKESFKELFRLMAIIEGLKEFCCNFENPSLRNSMKKTINNALKGFDYLIQF